MLNSRAVVFTPVALCLLAALPAFAQPPGRGGNGVSAGHVQFNSANPEAAIAFWTDVIGTTTYSYESMKGVSTLGITILFTQKAPTGPSAGSVIDHIAFKVPDVQPFTERLAKTPYKGTHPQGADDHLMIDGPDGVRIELIEDNSMYAGLEFSHIHINAAKPAELRAWYLKNFGGRGGPSENADSLPLPGAPLLLAQADSPAPTAGRAIDHITFEVRDLDAFCKKLADNAVKLDAEPKAVPELKARIAVLTDPWGMRIELMEKLSH